MGTSMVAASHEYHDILIGALGPEGMSALTILHPDLVAQKCAQATAIVLVAHLATLADFDRLNGVLAAIAKAKFGQKVTACYVAGPAAPLATAKTSLAIPLPSDPNVLRSWLHLDLNSSAAAATSDKTGAFPGPRPNFPPPILAREPASIPGLGTLARARR